MPTATAKKDGAAVTDAVFTTIKTAQDLAVSSFGALVDAASKAFPLPALEGLDKLAFLPNAREIVETGFGVAEDVLKVQKQLVTKLVDAVTPASV